MADPSAAIAAASPATAPTLAAGDPLNLSALHDQHDQPFDQWDRVRTVLFVRGMKAKDLSGEALRNVDTSCLQEFRVAYVADISGMPGLISKLIALPRMRKLPYPIWLDRDGETTRGIPANTDTATLLAVSRGAVGGWDLYNSAEELAKRLRILCGPAEETNTTPSDTTDPAHGPGYTPVRPADNANPG